MTAECLSRREMDSTDVAGVMFFLHVDTLMVVKMALQKNEIK